MHSCLNSSYLLSCLSQTSLVISIFLSMDISGMVMSWRHFRGCISSLCSRLASGTLGGVLGSC
jgi:hypothetical protein